MLESTRGKKLLTFRDEILTDLSNYQQPRHLTIVALTSNHLSIVIE